jgi:hypothetical protein
MERGFLNPQLTDVTKKKDDPNYDEKVEYNTVLADFTDFLIVRIYSLYKYG